MKKIIDWILRLVPAIILLQTLFFKYSGAQESVAIFEQMGMEPWGRYLIATLELIASVLLLLPRTVVLGAVLALGLMLGAIGGHLTKLGIEVAGDGGTLFIMALVVAICSAILAWMRKGQIIGILMKQKLT